jgi:hypothetical protein
MEVIVRTVWYKLYKDGRYTHRNIGVMYNAADPLARARKVANLKKDYPEEEGYTLVFEYER